MDPARREWASEDDYLARERTAAVKHEYVDGQIVDMAGASFRHNQIAAAVLVALGNRLRGGPCTAVASDQRVAVRASRMYTYPDVLVVCGKPEFHPNDADTLMNPTVIVEVLSDSTEAYDRGEKFAHYRKLPSLQEYVLVSQRRRRVEHFRRVEVGQWLLTSVENDGVVRLSSIGVEVPVEEIYANTDIADEGPPEAS